MMSPFASSPSAHEIRTMTAPRTLLCALLLLAASPAVRADLPTEGPVKPKEIRKVYGDGKHNAFTAFVRWRGALWLAFRQADSHNSGDGDLVVLRSKDGRDWSEALRLNVLPDDRDPQFLATERRLFADGQGLPLARRIPGTVSADPTGAESAKRSSPRTGPKRISSGRPICRGSGIHPQ